MSSWQYFKALFSWKVIYYYYYFLLFLGSHPWHLEVPRLGVELELQLPAYATATAMQNPSHVCDLHHSSQQHQILNPLSEARDWTHNLMVPSWIRFCCSTTETPLQGFLYIILYFLPAEMVSFPFWYGYLLFIFLVIKEIIIWSLRSSIILT